MRTRVKICGLTTTDDAQRAAYLGADAIGLVFYPPSPRNVDVDQALSILQGIPPFVTVVGLFVDETVEIVSNILSKVPLDLLQFHGDESADYCRSFGRPYLKAVRMNPATDLMAVVAQYRSARGLLLDADSQHAKGGAGNAFDWALVPAQCPLPIALAGGLNPTNVGDALRLVRPYGVDVSSGVEREKGVKDANKMAAFLQQVKEFDYGQRNL